MDITKIAVVILVIALLGCGGYIVYKNYPGLLHTPDVSPAGASAADTGTVYQTAAMTQSPQQAAYEDESSAVTYIHSGEVYATPSEIRSMDLYVEPVDWDSVVGNDGIVIHFNFYDQYGRKVVFSGSSISCEINVLTPQTDTLMRTVSPRKVLYKGYTTITSSDQGEGGPLAGIRIAYSDLNMGQYDRGIGQIKVKASLPAGGIVIGEETYLYTKS